MSCSDDIPAERVLGGYSSGLPGPLLLIIAGTQADDINAAHPIRSFLDLLQQQALRINGSFLALYGDSRQQQDLVELDQVVQQLRHQHADICFVDFHTTAAPSIPYLAINAHAHSMHIANRFPLHTVSGLQRSLPGGFAERCNTLGCRGFAFEAGQHRSAAAFSNQVAFLWLLLVFAGAVARREVRNFSRYERMLALDSPSEHRHFQLASHYRGTAEEEFVLQPGLRNFDQVSKDCCVAMNRHGAVLAPSDGFLLLPAHHRGEGYADPGFYLLEEAGVSANDEDSALAANEVGQADIA